MHNQRPSSKKTWIWMAIIVIVALIAYFLFFSGAPSSSSQSLLQTGSGSDAVGTQVLGLLNQIQALQIDASLFQSQAYRSLQDYSVAIPPQNVGRNNPFAPIPGFTAPTPSGH
ncbi:hypothetical protein KGQ27_03875 [Patescibacteria group bacterium]|nr:hypothetical protein [Patescibacteria group bacterium]MDE2011223.1 hypothetical protein [Patescibacteria group bacterium]MDE2233639.1 hypothetical protein [Patescibacteria group bacterium]